MDQLVQVLGAFFVLTAFTAVQVGSMRPTSRIYLGLNLAGSAILALLAAIESQWGFFLLEGVWAIVSASGLAKSLRAPARA